MMIQETFLQSFSRKELCAMGKKDVLTKILAIIGSVLVCLPVLAPRQVVALDEWTIAALPIAKCCSGCP